MAVSGEVVAKKRPAPTAGRALSSKGVAGSTMQLDRGQRSRRKGCQRWCRSSGPGSGTSGKTRARAGRSSRRRRAAAAAPARAACNRRQGPDARPQADEGAGCDYED